MSNESNIKVTTVTRVNENREKETVNLYECKDKFKGFNTDEFMQMISDPKSVLVI